MRSLAGTCGSTMKVDRSFSSAKSGGSVIGTPLNRTAGKNDWEWTLYPVNRAACQMAVVASTSLTSIPAIRVLP